MVVRDAEGLNAGPPVALLAAHPITPASLFFSRSHAAIPTVDPAAYRLRVHGLVRHALEFTLEQLGERFPLSTGTATLVCAGLRRDELIATRPIPGELPWSADPISTGEWGGVSLAALLRAAGPLAEAQHVGFLGLDQVERHGHTFGFGGSVPLEKALGEENLLAMQLNGAPLPREHGYPVRGLIPGYIGARSVKWLTEIVLLREPSTNYFQAHAYRVLREPDPDDPRDVTRGEPLGSVALNSVIVTPGAGERLAAGTVDIVGWALAPSGRQVTRVELSGDGGLHWQPAALHPADRHGWAWCHWSSTLHLTPGAHTLVVRARDSAGGTQPPELREVWNAKGYANNAWHRVVVEAA
jgi:sulfite oxidase